MVQIQMKKEYYLLSLCLFMSIASFAQDSTKVNPVLTNRFIIGGGIFYPAKDFKIGLNGTSENEIIDFNKVFTRGDKKMTPLFNAQWRFWEKWILQAEYFKVKNESGNELEEDLAWRDVIFKEGTYAKSGVALETYRIFLGRQIVGGPKYEIGAGLGLHSLIYQSYIEGEIKVEENTQFKRETADFNAPLPDIGIWAIYAPHPKWSFDARLDWFYISIDEYSGGLWDIAPSVTYQAFKNIGATLSYHYFTVDLEVDKSRVNGNFDLTFQGPSLSVFGNF